MGHFSKVSAAVIAVALTARSVCRLTADEKEGYNSSKHRADKAMGAVQNGIFALLTAANRKPGLSYSPDMPEYFYNGTDGLLEGKGWKAGFTDGSIIPEKWRCTPDGTPDKNGFCLDSFHSGGGYQAEIDKIYSDQLVSALVLSAGNGKIMIAVSVDGIGITNGVCREIRREAEIKLSECKITHGDIISFTVSATHCHSALDTQGMYWKQILRTIADRKNADRKILEKEMHDCIVEKASDAVLNAFKGMEDGRLYFFNTEKADGVKDKFNCGAKTQSSFSSFLFEGKNGKKIIISNIGAHPVSANAFTSHMVCCDYPHYMKMAMKDAGYDFMFIQGAQAGVSTASAEESEETRQMAQAHYLSKEDWVRRYGEDTASELYDKCEQSYRDHINRGYALAHFVLGAVDVKEELEPVINSKFSEIKLDCDYGLMGFGAASGMLGFNSVKSDSAECSAGIITEIGYIELGKKFALITIPGEIFPALIYGTDSSYQGNTGWSGKQSWSGNNWCCKSIEEMVKSIPGNESKQVIAAGITNDEIGYILPDTSTTESIIAPLLWYNGEGGNELCNSMLMTVSSHCATDIIKGFEKLLDSENKNKEVLK